MGYQELQHTADWALHVWADDLPSLFAEAARGMNALSGVTLQKGRRVSRAIDLQGEDAEGLLVLFLTELIYVLEQERIGFDRFDLRISDGRVSGQLDGSSLKSLAKPVKAVTYHNLGISKTLRGYEVEIVFDV
jgi:SHS2 domain-containing protein